jgi:hypothetical protein
MFKRWSEVRLPCARSTAVRAGSGRDVELCRFEGVTVVFGGLRALNGLEFGVDSDDGAAPENQA